MLICKTKEALKTAILTTKQQHQSIGFVPTMGALHAGHCSLIARAHQENDTVLCSIFVNPIQFNNAHDLKTYPRNLEQDIALLEANHCDILFAPSVEEMYAEPPQEKYSFGLLDEVMEGPRRPGHFNGVATVVRRFFDLVQPERAYFGEKDYQQVAIIKKMVADYNINVKIIACPIIREKDGLALSSRNVRLTYEHRKAAPLIHHILTTSRALFEKGNSIRDVKEWVLKEFLKYPDFKVEYYEIVDDISLQPLEHQNRMQGIVGCIAVWMGDVRLIDIQRYQ